MANKIRKPLIRFKGFTDDWEQRKLGEITGKIIDKNSDMAITETLTNSAEFGIISQTDFFDHAISKLNKLSGYTVVRKDYFVYNPRISVTAPVGPINRNKLDRDGVMSPLYTVFSTHDIDNSFLEWFFKNNSWHKFMRFNGDSGARSDRFSIKDEVFFRMPVLAPNDKEHIEQKHIGKFFEQLEHVITLHQRKLDKLLNIKKSMLDKMFPKNGSDKPEIRFKGFTDAWEQRKLGEIAQRVIVGLATSVTPYYREEGIPILRNLNIKENYLDDNDVLYLDSDYANKQVSKQIHTGDVLTVHTGYIGTSCVVPSKYDKCLTFTTLVTTTNNDKLIGSFLSQYLNSDSGMISTQMVTTQGGRQNLNTNDFEKVEIPFPSVDEQNKIYNILELFDQTITLHQRKLEKLKNLKKACLERMFV